MRPGIEWVVASLVLHLLPLGAAVRAEAPKVQGYEERLRLGSTRFRYLGLEPKLSFVQGGDFVLVETYGRAMVPFDLRGPSTSSEFGARLPSIGGYSIGSGSRVVVRGDAGLEVRDLLTGEVHLRIARGKDVPPGTSDDPSLVALSPDGSSLLAFYRPDSAGEDACTVIRSMDLVTGKKRYDTDCLSGDRRDVEFTPDGRRARVWKEAEPWGGGQPPVILDVGTGKALPAPDFSAFGEPLPNTAAHPVRFVPRSALDSSGSVAAYTTNRRHARADAPLWIWEPGGGGAPRVLQDGDGVAAMEFTRDGSELRILGAAGVRGISTSSGDVRTLVAANLEEIGDALEALRVRPNQVPPEPWAVAATALGRGWLAVARGDGGGIRVLSVVDGAVRTLEGHRGRVEALSFHPTRPWLLSAGRDQTLRVWDLETGRMVPLPEGHEGPVRSLAITLDRSLVLSGGDDGSVCIWEPETARLRRRIMLAKAPILGLGIEKERFYAVGADGILHRVPLAGGEGERYDFGAVVTAVSMTGEILQTLVGTQDGRVLWVERLPGVDESFTDSRTVSAGGSPVTAVYLDRSQGMFASREDGALEWWLPGRGASPTRLPNPLGVSFSSLAFGAQTLLFASFGGGAALYNLQSGRFLDVVAPQVPSARFVGMGRRNPSRDRVAVFHTKGGYDLSADLLWGLPLVMAPAPWLRARGTLHAGHRFGRTLQRPPIALYGRNDDDLTVGLPGRGLPGSNPDLADEAEGFYGSADGTVVFLGPSSGGEPASHPSP